MYLAPAWIFDSAILMSPTFSCRHDLHDADRADRAARLLPQLGFLETLGGEHEWIETVLLAVLLEKHERLLEALPLGRAGVVGDLHAVGPNPILSARSTRLARRRRRERPCRSDRRLLRGQRGKQREDWWGAFESFYHDTDNRSR
jgi:hypothetical protein